MPKVSIILPTYNGERFIRKAIQSVLRQSFSNWELLVIDDGSTLLTTSGSSLIKKIVDDFSRKDKRIIYLKNKINLGIQKSLNLGIKNAKGEYLARIDDDDEWLDKDKLKKQAGFLENNRDYVLVGTGTVVVGESGKELFRYLNPQTDVKIRKYFLAKNCFSHCSVVFRKATAVRLGGYREDLSVKHVEDYDLFLKLGTVGKLANLPIFGIKWMLRDGSLSSKNRMAQFKNGLGLVLKYRKDYPRFFPGYLRAWARFVAYGLFRFIPILRLKYLIFKTGREK